MQRILLIGKDGQLGSELLSLSLHLGTVQAFGRSDCNLEDPGMVARVIRQVRPHWIINAGAYTNVDGAEKEIEKAYAVNGHALAVIGEEAKKIDAKVIHYSTDYVFDGRQSTPYQESDSPSPLGVYGKSKLAGEKALLESGAPCLIFRTSWLYGFRCKNFLKSILRAAARNNELRVVSDQSGNPTWVHEVAVTTAMILRQLPETDPRGLLDKTGIYHMVSSTHATRKKFAEFALAEFQRRWGARMPLRCERILGITTQEFGAAAPRPAWSVLSCDRLHDTFGLRLPTWQDQLTSFFESVADPGALMGEETIS